MLKFVAFASALAALAFGASTAQAATTLSAGPSDACGKSGCFTETRHTFTQTFSAGAFNGPANISALRIDKALVGDMKDHVLKISFVRSDGSVVSNWGGWMLAVLQGDTVTLSGPAFDWDAGLGDLTLKLDLFVPGAGGAGGGISLAAPPPFQGGFFGSVPPSPPPPFVSQPQLGLAESPFMVPEPSTWALLILGFGGAGAMLRRTRRPRPVVLAQPCG